MLKRHPFLLQHAYDYNYLAQAPDATCNVFRPFKYTYQLLKRFSATLAHFRTRQLRR